MLTNHREFWLTEFRQCSLKCRKMLLLKYGQFCLMMCSQGSLPRFFLHKKNCQKALMKMGNCVQSKILFKSFWKLNSIKKFLYNISIPNKKNHVAITIIKDINHIFFILKDHSGFGLSQWVEGLQWCSFAHWLSSYPERSLILTASYTYQPTLVCTVNLTLSLSLKASDISTTREVSVLRSTVSERPWKIQYINDCSMKCHHEYSSISLAPYVNNPISTILKFPTAHMDTIIHPWTSSYIQFDMTF